MISKKFHCGKGGVSGDIAAEDVGGLWSPFIDIAYNVSDRYRISLLLLSLTMLTSNLHQLLAESSDLLLCPISLVLHHGHILNRMIMARKIKHDLFSALESLFYEKLVSFCPISW